MALPNANSNASFAYSTHLPVWLAGVPASDLHATTTFPVHSPTPLLIRLWQSTKPLDQTLTHSLKHARICSLPSSSSFTASALRSLSYHITYTCTHDYLIGFSLSFLHFKAHLSLLPHTLMQAVHACLCNSVTCLMLCQLQVNHYTTHTNCIHLVQTVLHPQVSRC